MKVSINKVGFKEVGSKIGHEGESLLVAELSVGRKKIATYEELDYGGCPIISFVNDEAEHLFNSLKDEYYQHNPADDTSALAFVSELVVLNELGIGMKKNKRKGYPVTFYMSYERRVSDTMDYPRKPSSLYGAHNLITAKTYIEEHKPEQFFVATCAKDLNIKLEDLADPFAVFSKGELV